MLPTTIDLIKAGLKSDPTLSAADRARLMGLLRNGGAQSARPMRNDPPRILRRAEAASRLGCSLRTIDKLAKAGLLPKRRLPGRTRACGILESDLLAIVDQSGSDGKFSVSSCST
jgi:hypothetical protein